MYNGYMAKVWPIEKDLAKFGVILILAVLYLSLLPF
jgi:hypothetical protein